MIGYYPPVVRAADKESRIVAERRPTRIRLVGRQAGEKKQNGGEELGEEERRMRESRCLLAGGFVAVYFVLPEIPR